MKFWIGLLGILLLVVPAMAANDVAANATGNATLVEVTAVWSELLGSPYSSNLTVSTGTGMTSVLVSFDSRVNYTTAYLYGRMKRDGVVINQYNITASSLWQSNAFLAAVAETEGTHTYGLEVYSTAGRKGQISRWNMSVQYLNTGSFSGYNATYDDTTNTVNNNLENWNVTYNATYDTKTTLAAVNTSALLQSVSQVSGLQGLFNFLNTTDSQLQANDTADRTYVNATFLPTSTYGENFPNSTVASKEATWDAKEPAISQGVFPQFWMFNKTWQNITTTWVTEGVNLWFTDTRAISAVESILDAINQSSAANNTASQGRDDAINSTKANKTDISEFTGGTIGNPRYGTGIVVANISDYWSNLTTQGYITNNTAQLQSVSQITGLQGQQDAQNTSINTKVNKTGDSLTGDFDLNSKNLTEVYDIFDPTGKYYLKNSSVLCGVNMSCTYNANGSVGLSSTGGTGGITMSEVNASADLYRQNAANLSGTINYSVVPALPRANVSGQEGVDTGQNTSITNIESVNTAQNVSISNIEAVNIAQNASIDGKEPIIATGLATQYWNGLKQWITLGVGNITGLQDILNTLNTTNVNQDTNLSNQAAYDNSTFGTKTWINSTNEAQDVNLTVTRTFINTTNRINGGFSPYFKNVAVGDVYELPFIFYNGTLKCVGLRATDGNGNVTMSVGNRSNDITGGNNLILNNAQETKDCTLTGWNTTVNIDEVFKLTVLSVNGSIGNLSVPFVIARD